ncbi:MAG: LON peptidase substrate-binding domain-containing protein, partial [Dokdonella sp.]
MTDKPNKSQKTASDLLELPVLPLRDVVVFPHMVIPLFVGREKSVRALEIAMAGNKKILLVAQRSPDIDEPNAGDLYTIGTVASVLQLLKLPDGTIKVLVEGVDRAEIATFGERDGLMIAHARVLETTHTRSDREIEVISRQLTSLFEQLVKLSRKIPPELMATLAGIEDSSRLADTIASHIAVRVAEKQRVLETVDVADRQELLVGMIDGEIDVQQIEKRIRGRVKTQMEKSQREYYLNEQMKAIQKELGDSDEA